MVDLNPIDLLRGHNPFDTTKTLPAVGPAKAPKSSVTPDAPQTAADAAASAASATAPIPASQQGIAQQLQMINPLAMQLFTQHILMPWMQQLQAQTANANKTYQANEQQIASQPFMQGNKQAQALLAATPQEQLGNTNLTNAYLGAAVAAPEQALQAQAMQQIQTLLQQDIAQQQKLAAYQDPSYQILAAQAQTGGALGSVPGLGLGTTGTTTTPQLPTPTATGG